MIYKIWTDHSMIIKYSAAARCTNEEALKCNTLNSPKLCISQKCATGQICFALCKALRVSIRLCLDILTLKFGFSDPETEREPAKRLESDFRGSDAFNFESLLSLRLRGQNNLKGTREKFDNRRINNAYYTKLAYLIGC
jgi:hypothetical protein